MYIAFDTETHPIANGQIAPPIVCLQYYNFLDDDSTILVGDEIKPFALNMLQSTDTIIGQNVAFDMAVLSNMDPDLMPLIFAAYEQGRVQCTKVRERLLDLAQGKRAVGYHMGELAKRYRIETMPDKSNPWRVRYNELEGLPVSEWPEEAVKYAKEDPIATYQIWNAQNDRYSAMEYEGFIEEAARETSYDFACFLLRCWGMRTDQERIKKLLVDTDKKLSEITPALQEVGLMRPTGSKVMTNIKKRIEQAFETMGEEVPLTEKGATSTSEETLTKCADPMLDLIIEQSKLTKLKSTYILKLIEGINQNIHASFHVLGADTGRTSCSKPNLQNQNKEGGVRECFIPRPGCVFIAADYDAQEVRTLAQACKDILGYSVLADKFKSDPGFDPHTDFAAQLMGWTYKDAMKRKAEGDKEVKEKRQHAKAANFGFPGGLGAETFQGYARKSYGLDLDYEQAIDLKKAWFDQWPEMDEYFKHVSYIADCGQLTQLRSNRVRGNVTFCSAANSYFQGLASDASKTALFLVSKACYAEPDSPLYNCRPVILVHDEIIVEAPEQQAAKAAAALEELMTKAMAIWCPDVPASASPVLARRWSKKAEPVYDKNNQLIPWEESL